MTHNRVPLAHIRYDIAHSWQINPGRPIKVELTRSPARLSNDNADHLLWSTVATDMMTRGATGFTADDAGV
jgi:hypothetical protein